MNERCDNCGTELFAGQQFCRRCGAPTRGLSDGETPTQILPGAQGQPPHAQQQQQPTAAQSHAATTPLRGGATDEVYRSRVEQFLRPPAAPPAPMSAMPLEGGRRSGWRGWLIALVCLLGFVVAGSLFAARYAARQFARKVVVVNKGGARSRGDVPPLPPMPGVPAAEAGDLDALDESGAQVSGGETVITKTFPLKDGATFSLANTAGDISVEGWDGAQAQVKITKRGGSADERAEVEIMHEASDKGLSFTTGEHPDDVEEVRYEIKLPRGVRRVEINSRESNVSLANLAAEVALNVVRGDLSLKGLTGALTARTMQGDVSVDLKNATPAAAQSLSAVSGNISLSVGGANAELKAETVSGGVRADDDLGLAVGKGYAGEHAAGTLGRGGESITVKTVSGNIKIKH
jgi:hypothetical protein